MLRYLIDGYNLMHAAGLMPAHPRRGGGVGLRHARRRFLDRLLASLDADTLRETRVVFDAAGRAVPRSPAEHEHGGLRVIYAVGDENADARLERLIQQEADPRTLCVVSTDHRIREAARRRRCPTLTADEFWVKWDAPRRTRRPNAKPAPAKQPSTPRAVPNAAAPETEQTAKPRADAEVFHEPGWRQTMDEAERQLEELAAAPGSVLDDFPTDAEIEMIAREVERESLPQRIRASHGPQRRRPPRLK